MNQTLPQISHCNFEAEKKIITNYINEKRKKMNVRSNNTIHNTNESNEKELPFFALV